MMKCFPDCVVLLALSDDVVLGVKPLIHQSELRRDSYIPYEFFFGLILSKE
jgi:hypothetical protein